MGWLEVIISISRDNIFQKDVNVLTHRHKLRVFISDYKRTLLSREEKGEQERELTLTCRGWKFSGGKMSI